GRLQPKREHFGIGGSFVLAPEGFDSDLHKFRRRAGTVAKDRAEIAKAGRPARLGRLQIGARHWNGEIRAQAHFAALRVGGEKHAPADVFAGQIEEWLGRLQQRWIDLRIAGAHIGADERLGPRVRSVLRRAEPVAHSAIVHITIQRMPSVRPQRLTPGAPGKEYPLSPPNAATLL